MRLYLLLLAAFFSAISAQEDMFGKAFIFPQGDVEGYVTLKSAQEEPLQSFTICLKSFSNLIQDYILFSYATKDQDRDIFIFKTYEDKDPTYTVYIGGEGASFRVPDSYVQRQSTCITWESETGVINLYIGGLGLARRVVQKGYRIGPDAVIKLGSGAWPVFRGSAFSGEIQEVYMWNVTIPKWDVIATSWPLSPIIDWRNLQYEIKGNVALC